MKMTILAFVSIFLNFMIYASDESKIKMRQLVEQIKIQAGDKKYLILQNGTDIYFNNKTIDLDFLKNISGVSQESLYFGGEKLSKKTSSSETLYLLKNLQKIKENDKPIFFISYTTRYKDRITTKKKMRENHFIGEAVPSYSANKIFNSINAYNNRDINSLAEVTNFLYLLNPEKFKNKKNYFKALKNTNHDMLIIEPSINGDFFTKDEIEALKVKRNGGKRIVIAYFSIGEAEDYRYYWKVNWDKKRPKWIVKENPNWKGNYVIEYWSDEWKKIIKDYQKKLDSIGVDGYYLDTIDTYQEF